MIPPPVCWPEAVAVTVSQRRWPRRAATGGASQVVWMIPPLAPAGRRPARTDEATEMTRFLVDYGPSRRPQLFAVTGRRVAQVVRMIPPPVCLAEGEVAIRWSSRLDAGYGCVVATACHGRPSQVVG